MPRCYVTDLTHFLDDQGDIVQDMPTEARQLASFLTLIVDAVTAGFPGEDGTMDTRIRCRSKGCRGSILGTLHEAASPIHWQCPVCHQEGVISHWQKSRWDNTPPQPAHE